MTLSFTPQQVCEIRKKYVPGVFGSRRIAKEYGVHRNSIANILKGKTYKCIGTRGEELYNRYSRKGKKNREETKEELWSRMNRWSKRTEQGCLEWTGQKTYRGYGTISYKGKINRVHRISAWLHYGFDITNRDIFICHHCDNRICFEPKHLFIGTHTENMRDAGRKWRTRRLLTKEQVLEIRELQKTVGIAPKVLIERYKVSCITLRKIHLRKTYAEL